VIKKSPIIIVIIALFIFAGIYFLQTCLVRNEHSEVVKLPIEKCADLNLEDKNGHRERPF